MALSVASGNLKTRWSLLVLQFLLALVILVPFFWMLSVSFKPAEEPFSIPARWWPESPTLANYASSFIPEFRRYFLNSVLVSFLTLCVSIGLGLLAAYSFTRFQFRILGIVLVLIILAQLFPAGALIIPIYKMMRSADLLNTYFSLVVAYVTLTLPVAIWMLRSFVSKIPTELEEAARIDGATRLQAFLKIVVPLSRPGIAATAVWIIVVTWQEFLFALAFTSTREMRTLPVGINDFIGQYGIRYCELMSSSVVISTPVIVIFFFLQRHFVAGLTAGSVKG